MTESNEMKEQAQEEDILSNIDVAKYFSILVNREADDLITVKKLHKLINICYRFL
ncbi:hypothetical protein [Rickettsia felis]|uniref:hypothetical protein n=1 Tax=Rickettsia felis TaxID=42862 RepID=UPI000AE92A25|nr:hypothetical protein [Rickettsia felis]